MFVQNESGCKENMYNMKHFVTFMFYPNISFLDCVTCTETTAMSLSVADAVFYILFIQLIIQHTSFSDMPVLCKSENPIFK